MTIRTKRFGNPEIVTHVPSAPLGGGRPAMSLKVASLMRDADRAIAHGARIVGRVGVSGTGQWRIPNTSNAGLSHTHPLTTHEMTVARQIVRLTPGYFLRALGAFLPSGGQQEQEGSDFIGAGAGGRVKIQVRYTDALGATLDVTRYLTPPASGAENGAEPLEDGAGWAAITTHEASLAPVAWGVDEDIARRWSEGVTAEVTIFYVGSVRPIDICIYEQPLIYARDVTDDEETFSTLIFTGKNGQPPVDYPHSKPIRYAYQDPTHGSRIAIQAARAQPERCGPSIVTWTSHREGDTGITDTDADDVVISGSSWVDIAQGTTNDWSSGRAGWSISSAGLARRFYESSSFALRDRCAAIPVLVAVYGSVTAGSTTARVRVQVEDHSLVELSITSTTEQWHEVWGCLRAPLNGEQDSVLLVLGKVLSGAGNLRVRHVQIAWLAQPD